MNKPAFWIAMCALVLGSACGDSGDDDDKSSNGSADGGTASGGSNSGNSGSSSQCDENACQSCVQQNPETFMTKCETICAPCADTGGNNSGGTTGSTSGSSTGSTNGNSTGSTSGNSTGPAKKDIGESCKIDSDCASDDCPFGLGYCTKGCSDFSDCPSFWNCATVGGSAQKVCQKS